MIVLSITVTNAGHFCVKQAADKIENSMQFVIGTVAGFALGKADPGLLNCKDNSIGITEDLIELMNIFDKLKQGKTGLIDIGEDLDHLARIAMKAPSAFDNCKTGAETLAIFY